MITAWDMPPERRPTRYLPGIGFVQADTPELLERACAELERLRAVSPRWEPPPTIEINATPLCARCSRRAAEPGWQHCPPCRQQIWVQMCQQQATLHPDWRPAGQPGFTPAQWAARCVQRTQFVLFVVTLLNIANVITGQWDLTDLLIYPIVLAACGAAIWGGTIIWRWKQ